MAETGDSAARARTASNFDWRIYADATCAGLSVLIPLPLVDIVFETIFRRRIPGTIAKVRVAEVAPQTRARLARPLTGAISWSSCFALPFVVARYVVRRLWRKIIYIFAVKDATSAVSEYWHRAFLTDHMIRAGHLAPGADIDLAVQVYRHVLGQIDPSPLTGLARQTVTNVRHVLRLLVRARRMGAAEVTRSLGEVLSSHWRVAEEAMRDTTDLYNGWYASQATTRDSSTMAG